jgi:tRNA A22 N-methylase
MDLQRWSSSVCSRSALIKVFADVPAGHAGGTKVLSPPLPPLAVNYVERKVPMEFIEKALFSEDGRIKDGSKRIVVTGIGGCGKTQLIRRLIEKYKHLCVLIGSTH